MKYGYAIVYVPDVEATISFCENAFGLTRRMVVPDGEYGELETAATRIGFAAEYMATGHGFAIHHNRPGSDATGFELALVTDDVQAAYDPPVAAGAVPTSEPKVKPWGQTVGYVRDNNGVLVELCSRLPD